MSVKHKKNILKEFSWLVGLAVVTIAISYFVLKVSVFDSSVDINFHDIYFVVAAPHVFIVLFVMLAYPVYAVRLLRGKLQNMQVNLVFLVLNLILIALIFVIAYLNYWLGRQTVNPPLSALSTPRSSSEPSGFFHCIHADCCFIDWC